MEIYQSLAAIPDAMKGGVIAIGNFDGVHRGHCALLAEAKAVAAHKGVKAGVLTFEPHPRKLFRPDDPPFRITPPEIKYKKLAAQGMDFTASLPFDWEFASQSAEAFVQNVLVKGLGASHVMTGADFRFGQLRKGSLETIRAAGIDATPFDAVGGPDGRKYSSTAVREALRAGDIAGANDILGWPWEIRGMIVRGDRRGHDLGYPTANVLLGDTLHPAYGVYATWVQIEGEDELRRAATNIGIRPMFELRQGQVEAYIMDFPDRDIYGKELRIIPVRRLRGEARFESLDALIEQIGRDCNDARHALHKAI